MSTIRRFVRQVGMYMARLQRRANLGAPDAGQMPNDIRLRPDTLGSGFKLNQSAFSISGQGKPALFNKDTQGDGWLRQVVSTVGSVLRIVAVMDGLFLLLMAVLLFGGGAFVKIVVGVLLSLRGLRMIFAGAKYG